MTRLELKASDGRLLVATRFDPPGQARASVVIAPAMAIAQSFYAAFATWLAGQGYAVWTFDYRGTGQSLQGSMRGAEASLTDWLAKDYNVVLKAAVVSQPRRPLFALGHSFGGQCVPLLPSRDLLCGLINIAVGSGAMRHNTAPIRRTAPLLWYLLVPLLCPLFGYFPGTRLGIIGDVPSGAMRQWRRWCLSPDYLLSAEPGARDAYASVEFPVLALTFADDELLLEAGSCLLHGALGTRALDYRLIEPQAFGAQGIGHSGFFRQQSQASLWPMVTEWMEQTMHHSVGSTNSHQASGTIGSVRAMMSESQREEFARGSAIGPDA